MLPIQGKVFPEVSKTSPQSGESVRSIGLVQIFLNFCDIVFKRYGERVVGLGLGLVFDSHIPGGKDKAVFIHLHYGGGA